MIIFNFADNFPSLNKWKRNVRNKYTNTNDQTLSENKFLLGLNYKLLSDFSKKQKSLYIPPLLIVASTLLIIIISIIPRVRIARLSPNHEIFNYKYNELQEINNKLKYFANELINLKPIHTDEAPTVLFAYFLQQSIPTDVKLSDYALNEKAFSINASSDNLNSLNEFISLLDKSMLVKEGTLSVKKLIKQSPANNTFQQSNYNTNSHNSFLEISGNLNEIDLEDKLKMYKETFNFGKTVKLESYLKALSLFKL